MWGAESELLRQATSYAYTEHMRAITPICKKRLRKEVAGATRRFGRLDLPPSGKLTFFRLGQTTYLRHSRRVASLSCPQLQQCYILSVVVTQDLLRLSRPGLAIILNRLCCSALFTTPTMPTTYLHRGLWLVWYLEEEAFILASFNEQKKRSNISGQST